MEGDQGAAAPLIEPETDNAVKDSFSQLWTDVMGMLVSSDCFGGGETGR